MKKYNLIAVVAFLTISLFVSVSNVNSADYFPLSVGNTWIYYPSFGANGNRVDTIIGEETINGIHTYIWNRQEAPDDNYNEKRWIAKDDSGVKAYKYWSNDGPDPAIIIDPPWLLFKSNPNVGDTFIGEFDPYTGIHYKTTSTIESVSETVTVPAGTFTNCVRIREKGEMTQNSVTTTVGWYKEWYAPNIGVVIYAKYSADWGSATTTQQLTGFSINGVPGDITGDGQITLTDEILALQVISLVSPSATINKQAEVNGDQKIGLEDAIYILQALAGLRTTSGKSALNVTKVGNGQGTVTSLPAGINCGSTCTAQYDSGTPVTLTATASSGSIFAGWSGAFTGMGTCQVTMNGNKSVTATFNNNTGPTCTYSISPTNPSLGPSGGSGAVSVTAGTGCTWTATSNNPWITITSGNNGTGTGSVSYTVAVNSGPERNGTITVAGRTVAVNQANSINPTSISYNTNGGSGAVSVTAGSGCTWTATSNSSWITITSGSSGTGNGSVSYTVAVNSGPERTGTITVAGKTFTVTQSANRPLVQIIPTAITIMLPKNVPQTFTISNIGPQGSIMEYVVADDGVLGGFLDVQNATGTLAGGTSATITVSVKPDFTSTGLGSLVGGTCVLNVYTPTAANYIRTPVSVYFVAAQDAPVITLSQPGLNFINGLAGGPDPENRAFRIINSGPVGSTLNYTISADQPWLSPLPTGGSLAAGESVVVTVSAITAGMTGGVYYDGTLNVIDSLANNSPQTIDAPLILNSYASIEAASLMFKSADLNGYDLVTVQASGHAYGPAEAVPNVSSGSYLWVMMYDCSYLWGETFDLTTSGWTATHGLYDLSDTRHGMAIRNQGQPSVISWSASGDFRVVPGGILDMQARLHNPGDFFDAEDTGYALHNGPYTASISATVSQARANPYVNGLLTIQLSYEATDPITVNYTVTGTAQSGSDFLPLPQAVTILPGASTAVIPIIPIDGVTSTGGTVSVTLTEGNGYVLGTNKTATVIVVVGQTLPPYGWPPYGWPAP